MRHLERSMLLQIIDNRWREHLYDMDYLREGIHLRGFAQNDPLIEYKNEGFTMFKELMNSIWEEFARYIFHVEVEIEPAGAEMAGGSEPAPTGGARLLRRRPRAALGARRRSPAQAGVAAARRRRPGRRVGGRRRRRPEVVETRRSDEHDKIGRNDPCWCGSARSTRSATAPS